MPNAPKEKYLNAKVKLSIDPKDRNVIKIVLPVRVSQKLARVLAKSG